MARGIWTGNISFGLVTIPVTVVSAENKKNVLDFDLLDKRDNAHVGYQKINKKTGEAIDNDDIVKGLKLPTGKYALFEQDELKELKLKGSSSIDIQQFIGRDEVDPIYFKKAYYLQPGKGGDKTYVLLRETLQKTQKYAVGLIILHSRQQLVLIGASGEALILHVVHYANEIKPLSDLDLPASGLKSTKVSPKEISMAERLVDELSEKWKPEAYKDTFFKDVQAAVQKKSRRKVAADEEEATDDSNQEVMAKVLDLMPLLEKSLKSGKGNAPKRVRAKAARR